MRKIKFYPISFFVVTLLYLGLWDTHAQIGHGGIPHGFSVVSQSEIPFQSVTPGDIKVLQKSIIPQKGQPLQFAIPVKVHFTPQNSGIWKTLPGGDRVWYLGIQSKGAYSLNIIFDLFEIPSGCKLFIYNTDATYVLGAFTGKNNKKFKKLATAPVPGDQIIVEFQVPASAANHGQLIIGQVAHDFLDIFGETIVKYGYYGDSGPCNVDINCPEGEIWQKEKYAVCRIIVGGSELCSGSLVNNTKNDTVPYFLTAFHCIENNEQAQVTIFFFDYESPYCDGPDGSVLKTLSGATLKATSDENLDFSLVELSKIPPFLYKPYYAGWNNSLVAPANTVTIHHPSGDVKKISIDDDQPLTATYLSYDDNAFWHIEKWEKGTTEPGSSGGPLFGDDHRLIGLLNGGDASCGNSVNDYFVKFGRLWEDYPGSFNQLKYWLDPLSGSGTTMEGLDPYGAAKETCDTFGNYIDTENLVLYEFGNQDSGFWTGHNLGYYTQYAEGVDNSEQRNLTGVYLNVAKAENSIASDKVTIKVWDGLSQPDNIFYSEDLYIRNFRDSTVFYAEFDSLIVVSGNFWVGYEIYYDSLTGPLTDQFAVYQVEDRGSGGINTAFAFKNDQWYPYSSLSPLNLKTSLGISVVMCGEIPSLSSIETLADKSINSFVIFPNPAKDMVTIQMINKKNTTVWLQMFDITGKLLIASEYPDWPGYVRLDLSGFTNGIYIIRLNIDHSVVTRKFSIIR
ncbi:MAG: T9SS type A sorting domain-containing protein [Bacteroidetes bacterium]|nr:T9SS type A sorting domain-containing protein [Bacteroidota bacterium]